MNQYPRISNRDALRTGVGITLLGVGAAGLLLPVVPGIPFLIAAALLLRRRETVRLPLTSSLSRADLTPLERAQVGLLLLARRVTMAAESTRRALRARRLRQRDY
jgi:hypothetical protein